MWLLEPASRAHPAGSTLPADPYGRGPKSLEQHTGLRGSSVKPLEGRFKGCLARSDKGCLLQDYHTIYKLCYSDLQGELQRVAREHIETEGHALYRKHTQTQPLGQPGVALKVRNSL